MNLWQDYRNRQLRAELRRALVLDQAPLAPQGEGLEQRLWQRLERSGAVTQKASSRPLPRFLTAGQASTGLWLAAPLAAAVIGAVVVNPHPQLASPEVASSGAYGIKGNAEEWPTLSSLRFAVSYPGQALLPGTSGMVLPVGAQLVFAAEGSGISPEAPLEVELSCHHGGRTVVVAAYTLRSNQETLHEAQDTIAFTLADVGSYQFFLRPRSAHQAEATGSFAGGVDHDAGFTVQVAAP